MQFTKQTLENLFNIIEIGKVYELELTGAGMDKPWSIRKYRISAKKKHDYSYSLTCHSTIPSVNSTQWGIIYHWIAPRHNCFSERVISAKEVL